MPDCSTSHLWCIAITYSNQLVIEGLTFAAQFEPTRFRYRVAILEEVTTADIGWPLPIGLPIVTMSGHTPKRVCRRLWHTFQCYVPCDSNSQKYFPPLPNPVCTSSITQSPPASCTNLIPHTHTEMRVYMKCQVHLTWKQQGNSYWAVGSDQHSLGSSLP